MGSDHITDKNASTKCKFQFTLPHGERPSRQYQYQLYMSFQFTLPHGERPVTVCVAADASGFNSRSRMGSDDQSGYH